ncbi:unnamed protein product, partial [Prunus brigantina]
GTFLTWKGTTRGLGIARSSYQGKLKIVVQTAQGKIHGEEDLICQKKWHIHI